ncbi:Polyadenylate-binding protein 4 [Rhizophlyctis rosea]|nr:Polyadenylate-binding protein 4 [Rhizophlyctis rosea]
MTSPAGSVTYADHEHAKRAIRELHGKEINGKELHVARFRKHAERDEEARRQKAKIRQEREDRMNMYQGVNLYVKNLDDAIDDEQLREEFSGCGNVTSAKVMKNKKTGAPKGFGFVCFSSPDEATKAIFEMNGRGIGGSCCPIHVALAKPKESRVTEG